MAYLFYLLGGLGLEGHWPDNSLLESRGG